MKSKNLFIISIFASLCFCGCANDVDPTTPSTEVDDVAATGITLNSSDVSLTVGETSQLVATVNPSDATHKTVTWSVSDGDEYVSVTQDGLVAALKAGNAVISAKTHNNLTATCNFTISDPVVTPVLPTDITLGKTTLDMVVGAKETLVATVAPSDATDKTIRWSVATGADVVSISQTGEVTALKVGNASIKATTSNGIETTCVISVSEFKIDCYLNDDVHSLISGNPFESVDGGEFVEVDNMELVDDVPCYKFTYGATIKFNLETKGYFEPTGLKVNESNVAIDNGSVTFTATVEDLDDPLFNFLSVEVIFRDNTPKIGDYEISTTEPAHITLEYQYADGTTTKACSQGDVITIIPHSSSEDYGVKNISGYTYTTNEIIQHKTTFDIINNGDGTYHFTTPYSHEDIKTIFIEVTEVNTSTFKNHEIVGEYAVIRTYGLSEGSNYVDSFQKNNNTPVLATFDASGEIEYNGQVAYASKAENGVFNAAFSTSNFVGYYGTNIMIFGESSSGGSMIEPLSAGSTDLVIAVKLTDGVGVFDITMDNNVFKVDGKTYGLFNFYNKGSLYASCFIDVENSSVITDTTISQYVGTSINDDKAVFDVIDKGNNKVISFGYQYDGGKGNHVIIADHLNGYTDANHSLVFINNNQAIYDDVLYSVSKDNNNLTLSGATHVVSITINPSNLTFVVTEEHDVEAKTLNIANLTFRGRSKGGNDLSIVFGPSNTEITGRIIQIDGCGYYWAFTAEFDATNNQLLLTINEVGYYYTYRPESTYSYSDEGAKKGVKKLSIEDGKLTFIENYSGMYTWDVQGCVVTCADFHY